MKKQIIKITTVMRKNQVIYRTLSQQTAKSLLSGISLLMLCMIMALPASAKIGDNNTAVKKANPKLLNGKAFNQNILSDNATRSRIPGKHVSYTQKFNKLLGIDVALDTKLYTNKKDKSFEWVVGVVTDLFNVNVKADQNRNRERIEVTSTYPVNKNLRVKGYISNRQQGKREFQDYSVGIAYSVNPSVEITAGYADRELKRVDAQSNVFLNVNGVF
jgi:hypothetical protein